MVTPQVSITTCRLLLRPFALEDAPAIQRLAGMPEIAATTINIPHPYPPGAALNYIIEQQLLYEKGAGVGFAIMNAGHNLLCGCIGLTFDHDDRQAELGYWIGVPFWGRGYATEAVRGILYYAFLELGCRRITARHFASNPASGRVLLKNGFQREGCRREAVYKEGRGYEDCIDYGLLRREFMAMYAPPPVDNGEAV